MKKPKIKVDIFNVVFLFVLFLFSLNFINKANYIYVAVMIMGLIIMYLKNTVLRFSLEFFILSICFTIYFLIYSYHYQISLQSFITFWIGPFSAYFIGYHIIDKNSNIKISTLFYTIVFGLFVHGFLNMLLFFSSGMIGRVIPDVWLGIGITATLQGTFFTLICSMFFYGIYICKSKILKIIIVFSIIFSVFSTLQTASRTLMIITIIMFVTNYLLYIFINKISAKKIMSLLIKAIIPILIAIVAFNANFLGIQDVYENSPLYERLNKEDIMSLGNDPRFEMYKTVAVGMFDYPMGGNKIPNVTYGYAHNLWLDTAKTVGIIPFFVLITYSFLTLNTLIKFIKSTAVKNSEKYLVFSVYFAMTLNFMVEPILEGVPYLFILMCMLNGATRSRLISSIKEKKHENTLVN